VEAVRRHLDAAATIMLGSAYDVANRPSKMYNQAINSHGY